MKTVTSQEWVLEQLEWRPEGEGHGPRCYLRHPQCAETYISRLAATVALLDSDLRMLFDECAFNDRVEAEVQARLAATPPKVVEKLVEVVKHDPYRDSLVMAVADWLEAVEARDEMRSGYGLDESDAYLHEVPEEYQDAEAKADKALAALRQAAERYLR